MPSRHASTRVEGAPPWMASRYADLRPGPLPKVEEKTRLIIVAREDLGKSTWHWSMEDMEECQVTMKKLHLRGLCPNTGAQPLMLMYIYIYISVCVSACCNYIIYIYVSLHDWVVCVYINCTSWLTHFVFFDSSVCLPCPSSPRPQVHRAATKSCGGGDVV